MQWLGLGPQEQDAVSSSRWSEYNRFGTVVAGCAVDEAKQARELVQHLHDADYDGVFVNVLTNRVQTNAVRYLSPLLRRIMIVHGISPGTYQAARAVREYVHATVGVLPRIREDLVRLGFNTSTTFAIPNAVNLVAFGLPRVNRREGAPIRVLYLGRIIDSAKGVFWLPSIMERLPKRMAQLTVVGAGPDLQELQLRCSQLGDVVKFTGAIPASDVPSMLACHDVLLFPSRFEGLPLTLLESMAAGCVPVATRIRDVTSFVVNDGQDGVLFSMGDIAAAARAIEHLHKHPEVLQRMSVSARRHVAARFGLDEMSSAYKLVLGAVDERAVALPEPLPLQKWSYPRGLKRGVRSLLPNGVKNFLRLWRERLA